MVFADKLKETEISEQDSLVAAQKSMKPDITEQDSLLAQDQPSEKSLAIIPVVVDQLTQSAAEDPLPVSWAPNTSEVGLSSVQKIMPRAILTEDFLKEELKTKTIVEIARQAKVQHSSVVRYAKKHGIDLEKSYINNRKSSTSGGRVSTLKEEPEASKKILKGKGLEESVVDTAEGMIKGSCETSKTYVKKLPQVMKVTFVKYTKMEQALTKRILMEVDDFTLEKVAEQYMNLFPGVELDDYHMVFEDKDGDWVVLRTTKELELAREEIGDLKLIFSIQPK